MNSYLYYLVIIFLCVACSDPQKPDPQQIPTGKGGVLIVNEGNFMRGNASLSLYQNGTLSDDVFASVNGRPLGDVAQSVTLLGKNAYVVVNNSGKIEMIDAESFKSMGTISGLRSPRYFLPVTVQKAYVTDLYANAISIIDFTKNTVIGKISCNGWTEKLILADKEVYVTNRYRPYVYVIDIESDQIKDSIKVALNGNSIVQDHEGQVWVLCGGKEGGLFSINPKNKNVDRYFRISNISDEIPAELTYNKTRDTLFFLNNGVFRHPIKDNHLQEQVFIPENRRLFYSLGINPNNSEIFTGNAIDFIQRGIVTRYRPDGTAINSFRVGIIPGEFIFLQ